MIIKERERSNKELKIYETHRKITSVVERNETDLTLLPTSSNNTSASSKCQIKIFNEKLKHRQKKGKSSA
jgi:hypothetical protein